MIPGPNTRNHEDLEEAGFGMSVGEMVSLQRGVFLLLEVVEMPIGDVHLPAHHRFFKPIQARQVGRLVNGREQCLVEARQESPEAHSVALLEAPRNWSSLYLKSTLKVVKLP